MEDSPKHGKESIEIETLTMGRGMMESLETRGYVCVDSKQRGTETKGDLIKIILSGFPDRNRTCYLRSVTEHKGGYTFEYAEIKV